MNTGKLTKPFRDLGLMHLLDKGKYALQKWKNSGRNTRFAKENREVKLPSDYMLFEAFQLLIERGKVVEGHRVFAAFHPPVYIRQLFEPQADILEHIEGTKKTWGLEQDVWIIKKKD